MAEHRTDHNGDSVEPRSIFLLTSARLGYECSAAYQLWYEFYINEYPYNSAGELGSDGRCDNPQDPEQNPV